MSALKVSGSVWVLLVISLLLTTHCIDVESLPYYKMGEVSWQDDRGPLSIQSYLVSPIKIIFECREDWGLLNTLPSFSMQRLKKDKVKQILFRVLVKQII